MAAAKVNTKFVAGLVTVLVLVVGAGGAAAYLMVFQNGERLAAQGDQGSEKGDWVKAEKLYSKAVNKEQMNPVYIAKWIGAMEKLTPETQNGYMSKYQGDYLGALRALARAKKTDIEAHRGAIQAFHDSLRYNVGDAGMVEMVSAVQGALDYFDSATDKKHEVLRRYRGMAYARGFVGAANLKDQEIEQGKKDLEAALVADPADGESAAMLARWYRRKAEVLKGKQDLEGAAEAKAAERKLVADFLAANPKNPDMALRAVEVALDELQDGVNNASTAADRKRANDELAPKLVAASENFGVVLDSLEPAKVLPEQVLSLMRVEAFAGVGGGKAERPERIARKIIEAKPESTTGHLVLAEILATQGKPVDAVAELQRLVDIKQKPISHEGQRQFAERSRARSLQAQYSIQAWSVEPDAAKKKEWLTKASEYRTKFAELVPGNDPELALLDAQIDFANDNFGAAQKKLLDYNTKTSNSNAQAVRMLAEASYKIGQYTRAEEYYRLVLQREPANLAAVLRIAGMCQAQGRNDDAISFYKYALQIKPDEQLAKQQLELLVARAGSGAADPSDPIVKGLVQADRLEQEGKADEAFAMLKQMFQKTPDTRIAVPLAVRMARRGEKDAALALLENQAKTDNDPRVRAVITAIKYDDPCQQREAMILQNPAMNELQKALALWQVYRDCGRKADATAMLAKAKALDPQSVAVLEFEFIEATERKDFATAEKLAEDARKRDSDLVEGATFFARLQESQGKLNDAVRTLEDASKKSSFGVEPARLLASYYVQQRRLPEAVAMLRGGLAKDNTHRGSLLALGSLLVQLGREKEALDEVRARQQIHFADSQVINMWLELEAMVGDREVAVAKRKQQLEISPNDRDAQIALAKLYVQNKEWPLARDLINRYKAGGVDMRSVEIEAQWFADQANLAGAKKVFDDYIASLPKDKVTTELLLAKGNFLERQQLQDQAAEAYTEAAKVQDPKTRVADKAIADLLLRRGKLTEAAAAFGEIVKAGADTPDRLYAKRQIDAYLQMRKGTEALAALDAMGAAVQQDAQMLGQLAEAAKLAGDAKRSAEALDTAVSKFPNDAVVYHRRALANQEFEAMRADVLRDFDRAIQLRPDYWQVRRDKARFLVRGKVPDMDGAIKEMREAVKYNPQIDELRVQLMRELFTAGRDSDALEVAEEVAAKRSNDVQLLVNLGALFREAGKNDRAADYYRRAYELSAQPFVVIGYIDLLHSMTPRNLEQVDKVLLKVGNKVIETEPALMMARGKQYLFRGKQDEGLRDIMNALRLIKPNQPELIMAWFGDVKRNAGTQVDRILDLVEKDNLIPGWPTFFRAGTLLEKPATEKQAIDMLEGIVSKEKDMVLVRQAYLILHGKYYQANDCTNGMKAMRDAATLFPDDSFLLNNLAFFMVKCGEDPKQAIPVAEKALQKATENNRDQTDVLDTLGWVYMKAGRLDDAMKPMLQALSYAGGQPSRSTILMHLAELLVLQGKAKDAEAVIKDAETVLSQQPVKGVGQEELLAEVKKKVADALKNAK